MRLHATARGLAGEYFYEAVGEALSLSGTVAGARHVVLTEKARSGHVTGTFSGDRLPSGGIAGTWEAPGGATRLPFTLAPIPRASGPGPVRVFKRAFRNQGRATEFPTRSCRTRPRRATSRSSTRRCSACERHGRGQDQQRAERRGRALVHAAVRGRRRLRGHLQPRRRPERDVSGEPRAGSRPIRATSKDSPRTSWLSTGEQLTLEQVFKKPFVAHAAKTFAAVDSMMTKNQSGGGPSADDAMYRDQLTQAGESPDFVFVDGGVRFWIESSRACVPGAGRSSDPHLRAARSGMLDPDSASRSSGNDERRGLLIGGPPGCLQSISSDASFATRARSPRWRRRPPRRPSRRCS